MPHSYGYRSRTRKTFAVPHGEKGHVRLSQYLTTYKVGDLVDVVGTGRIQKGMPHKNYHGKTGRVWNVTPRAIGVIINKRVNTRIEAKRIHVRIEHVKHNNGPAALRKARQERAKLVAEAKAKGITLPNPNAPRASFTVPIKAVTVKTVHPTAFEDLF